LGPSSGRSFVSRNGRETETTMRRRRGYSTVHLNKHHKCSSTGHHMPTTDTATGGNRQISRTSRTVRRIILPANQPARRQDRWNRARPSPLPARVTTAACPARGATWSTGGSNEISATWKQHTRRLHDQGESRKESGKWRSSRPRRRRRRRRGSITGKDPRTSTAAKMSTRGPRGDVLPGRRIRLSTSP